jgi:hypothetical protein
MPPRLSRVWEVLNLPAPARRLRRSDRRGLTAPDPGLEPAINAILGWLARAQDRSTAGQGGFSRHFDLIRGWGPSCPAGTGLAARILLQAEERWGDPSLRQRAIWGLEWLCDVQRADGAFGMPDRDTPRHVLTGQALLGLVCGAGAVAGASDAADRAARYLMSAQCSDGSWEGGRARDTQIAWALLEAEAVLPGQGFGKAAQANLRWALGQLRRNGWLENCCTDNPVKPLTVTITEAVRGFLEAWRLGQALRHLDAAVMTGWALHAVQRRDDGSLPGRLTEKWEPEARWSGLPGDAEAASCWMLLHHATGDEAFLTAARAANRFVRRTLALSGDVDQVGGVRGSFPIHGGHERFRYLTSGAVFALESQMMELALGRSA